MIKLVTFDAFGTLFRVWPSVAYHYRATLLSRGVSNISEDAISKAFSAAFKKQSADHPNFGRESVGDVRWWEEVVEKTFIGAGVNREVLTSATPTTLPTLLHRYFSTQGPFILYPETMTVLNELHKRSILVGVITDSDSRTPDVLQDLFRESGEAGGVDFVVTSYETGVSKPAVGIFEEALERAKRMGVDVGVGEALHVGDSVERDFEGAKRAGWHSLLLDRGGGPAKMEGGHVITSLRDVMKYVENGKL
ncbi:hypothetical protein HDU67_004912 [Dinochytrium kinnereticum]|nr:hypothetical protein HDU67_004912 [Dinochytrium kinnereticum]